jgi:hypothetical protein
MAGRSWFEEDTLCILDACWKHRGEYQTQKIIGKWTNLSQQRVSEILRSVDEYGPNDSVLFRTAEKYGFSFKLYKKRGTLIDVVYRGRVAGNCTN